MFVVRTVPRPWELQQSSGRPRPSSLYTFRPIRVERSIRADLLGSALSCARARRVHRL